MYKFFKNFPNRRKKTKRLLVFSYTVDLSPTFKKTQTTDETFQQSGKEDSFRNMLKSSTNMNESSGSPFFGNITGI